MQDTLHNRSQIFSYLMKCLSPLLLGVRLIYKKSVRVCICCSSRFLRLWHVPITVERATRSLTLYDTTRGACGTAHSTTGNIIPEGAYRCLILDCDYETARFQDVKNKRRINALIYVFAKVLPRLLPHPPLHPIPGLRGRYATAKVIKILNKQQSHNVNVCKTHGFPI